MENILNKWDKYALEYDFPVLDNFNAPLVACKVSLYQDETTWVVFFEVISYASCVENIVYAYGPDIESEGLQFSYGDIVLLSNDENDDWLLDLLSMGSHPDVYIQNSKTKLDLSESKFLEMDVSPDNPSGLVIARLIYEQYPEALWLSKNRLFSTVPELNAELPLVYSSTEWRHPDIIEGDLPSNSIFFQTLAKAITEHDVNKIEQGESNTLWLNWVDEEALVYLGEPVAEIHIKKIEDNQFMDRYHISNYDELFKIDFSEVGSRYLAIFDKVGMYIENAIVIEDIGFIDGYSDKDIKYYKNLDEERCIYVLDRIDMKQREEFLAGSELDGDDGYLNRIFLFKKGEYDSVSDIAKLSVDSACFMWDIDGDGGFLAVNGDVINVQGNHMEISAKYLLQQEEA
ncbi:hypothetical protein HCA81_06290 [Listeria booriae]|uniref:DUF7003 family protein n=1 Tax=Listeria booriae TaxID=1552123 RepID=UPI00162A5091|nr:hypothetical protein [Listeria booriae]MBC2020654.1 hypothetical protein [Listeria booriae]